MDILNKLEDLDSRIEKARGNVAKWFGLLAAVALAGVLVSYFGRSFLASKSERSWSVFDNHLMAFNGLSRGPAVWIKTDLELAVPEIREACGGSWGDLAALVQYSGGPPDYVEDIEKATAASQRVLGSAGTDRALREVIGFAAAEPESGGRGLVERFERLKAWAGARPGLLSNQPQTEGPETTLETDGGRIAFKWDPKIPSEVSAEVRNMISEGLLEGSKLSWNSLDRTFDLVLSGDAEKLEKLSLALEKISPDDPSFSLFKGTVVAKARQHAEGESAVKRTLGITLGDYRGREFDLIPIGAVTEGAEFLPAVSTGDPEKKEFALLGAK